MCNIIQGKCSAGNSLNFCERLFWAGSKWKFGAVSHGTAPVAPSGITLRIRPADSALLSRVDLPMAESDPAFGQIVG
jgi:hypothetical protein